MSTEQKRAEFDAWWDGLPASMQSLLTYEVATQAYELGRAALQSQEQPISYAGVTVWVGNKRCSHGVTKDGLELSTFDILQAAFDHARRVEGDGE